MRRPPWKSIINRAERNLVRWRALNKSPGRNVELCDDDVMLVSYPRSGNTWTRFLVGNLYWPGQPMTFLEIERRVPDIYRASRAQLAATARPRVIKSHEYFDPRYRKVIYIVRDPRDVAVSYYNYQRKTRVIGDDHPIEAFVGAFVAGSVGPYGSWAENVGSWLATRGGRADFLLLRYEDMVERTVESLQRIAAFAQIERSADELQLAVQRSSAEEMRDIERRDREWLVTQKSRKDIPFVGTAKSGGWKAALPATAISRIESEWAELLLRLDYELVSEQGQRIAARARG